MSQISFDQVPANARVPGIYIEIDNSLANTASELQLALIICANSGTATANTVYSTPNADTAADLFGTDSEAHKMVAALLNNAPTIPVYVIGTASMADALAALGDTRYHYIFSALNAVADLEELHSFLDDRYHATSQIPGLAFAAKAYNHADAITFTANFNSPYLSFTPVNSTDVSDAEFLCGYYGQAANSLMIDPARPLKTLQLSRVQTAAASEWDWNERNLFLHSGCSTYYTNTAGDVFIERPITTYRENASGGADDSYLDVTTIATAIHIRDRQIAAFAPYARHKLAADGTRFAPGQAVLTPSSAKGVLLELYRELEYSGLVQAFDDYKSTLQVYIDSDNPTRLIYQDQPVLINGLQIIGGKMQFKKAA